MEGYSESIKIFEELRCNSVLKRPSSFGESWSDANCDGMVVSNFFVRSDISMGGRVGSGGGSLVSTVSGDLLLRKS